MRYFLIKFKREVPEIEGMKMIVSLDFYSIFSFETDEAVAKIPADVRREEISELEATDGVKFYGQPKDHRRVYSDVEHIEPDPDELAQGKRKTKIYFTPKIYDATLSLMKKICINQIKDVFDTRESRKEEAKTIKHFENIKTIKQLNIEKEKLLGIEMPKSQAIELGLWDEEKGTRKDKVKYDYGF